MIHSLAQLDFAVIALALRDSLAGATGQGRLARWIFGRAADGPPLANPKLEALRQYVVLRHQQGDRLSVQERRALHNQGYSLSDLREIDRLIDHSLASRP